MVVKPGSCGNGTEILIPFTAEVLEKNVALRSLNKSTTRDHRSIFNWVRTENPLVGDPDKADFINRFDDFVSLSQRSQSTRRFEDFIQRALGDGPPSRLQVNCLAEYIICIWP